MITKGGRTTRVRREEEEEMVRNSRAGDGAVPRQLPTQIASLELTPLSYPLRNTQRVVLSRVLSSGEDISNQVGGAQRKNGLG
jgi:hypothetical protein